MYLFIQEDVVQGGLLFRLLLLILSWIIALVTRGFLMRRLNRYMMKTSTKTDSVETIESTVTEIPASSSLKIEEFDGDSHLPEAKAIRENAIKDAQSSFRRIFIADLAMVAVYWLLPNLIPDLFGDDIYYLYVGLLTIWSVMRFIGYYSQFQAYRSGVFGFLKPLWNKLFFPFQSFWHRVLSIVVMLLAIGLSIFPLISGPFQEALVFLLPVAFHLFLNYRLKAVGRKRNNLKLLILRVFLISKTSAFTFSRLTKYWKHFGSYFTVADPSFYKIFWKRKFNHRFPIFIIVLFLLFTQMTWTTNMETTGAIFGGVVFLLIIGAFIYVPYSTKRMGDKFIINDEHLDKRLAKLDANPVKYDNTFKEFPIMCYDNTWKIGVNRLVHEASVIMMDLRGFSEKNKGCEFEIDFILDHVQVQRIVFVCKPEALDLVKKTILERWEMLDENSPNHNVTSPAANLFIARKEDNKELQSIMDLLLKAAKVN